MAETQVKQIDCIKKFGLLNPKSKKLKTENKGFYLF